MVSGNEIEALIPHSGSMCLIESVMSFDDREIVCRSRSHQESGNPLRTSEGLSALCAVEYGAQAMALHSALTGRPVGTDDVHTMIASVRDVEMRVPRMDPILAPITITATLLVKDQTAAKYHFSVTDDEQVLVDGAITVALNVIMRDE